MVKKAKELYGGQVFKYIRIGGEDWVLERAHQSKVAAKKHATSLRKKTGSRVRVVKRGGLWGVYSA